MWLDIFRTRTKDWVFAPLTASQVPDGLDHAKITPETRYLSVWLDSMRVVDVRRGLSTFYGVVHSHMSLPHRSGTPAEFDVITTPPELSKVNASHLDRVIVVNKRLLGPVPYRGGDMATEIGLFSIKMADLAGPFISLLGSISSLAGVAFIGTALPYARPLSDGINLLSGGADATVLEVGVDQASPQPETGYFCVLRAPKDKVDAKSLRIVGADKRLVDGSGNPIADYPYIVWHVEAAEQRADWFDIPELGKAYQPIRSAVRENKYNDAKDALTAFKLIAQTCDDLLSSDGKRLYEYVKKDVEDIMGTTETSGARSKELCELRDVKLY